MTPAAYHIATSRRATKDLIGIHAHIGKDSPANASGVLQGILDAIDSLASTPHRTVVDPQPVDRRPPVRSLPVPPYTVYFRVNDQNRTVRVVRVRHGARRPLRRFD